MKPVKIVLDKSKSLRKPCAEISIPVLPYILDLGFKMRQHLINSQRQEYLEKHPRVRPGVGIAAPQVGKNIRMFAVFFYDYEDVLHDYVLVNPVITKLDDKLVYLADGEGCLSVEDVHTGYVYRNNHILVQGYELVSNENIIIELEGYPAIVFQHENDHLDGILFYDHIDKDDPFKKIEDAIMID